MGQMVVMMVVNSMCFVCFLTLRLVLFYVQFALGESQTIHCFFISFSPYRFHVVIQCIVSSLWIHDLK
jgi:hypothetical protein